MANFNWKEITKNSYDKHAQEFASFTIEFRGKLKKWIEKNNFGIILQARMRP